MPESVGPPTERACISLPPIFPSLSKEPAVGFSTTGIGIWRSMRDYLAKPFGGLVMVAPQLPKPAEPERPLAEVLPDSGISIVPSIDASTRTRSFWLDGRERWLNDVRQQLATASVMHSGMDDPFRPFQYSAHWQAKRMGVPTIFHGLDFDPHATPLPSPKRLPAWVQARTRRLLLDRGMAAGVQTADLALLKEGAIFDRYNQKNANVKAFCHTMYPRSDVIDANDLEKRSQALLQQKRLRFVYCGRLVRYKGLQEAIKMIAAARKLGADVEYDIIGSGEEEPILSKLITEQGLGSSVRLLGSIPYGPELLQKLRSYHALLFSPIEEDTPRMIYDGYAAGLPFLGTNVPFLKHRAASDHAAWLIGVADIEGGARQILTLSQTLPSVVEKQKQAREMGLYHANETWYQRRADWTVEMVQRCAKMKRA